MRLNLDDANFALAASIVERSRDLIADGWVKGQLKTYADKTVAAERFCILGALSLAAEEIFGSTRCSEHPANDLARTFITEEILAVKGMASIPGWNDQVERLHDEVLGVLDRTARKLWNLSLESDSGYCLDLSKYTEVEQEAAKQYAFAVLA